MGSCHTGNRFICCGQLGIFVKVSSLSKAMTYPLTYSLPGNRCILWISYNYDDSGWNEADYVFQLTDFALIVMVEMEITDIKRCTMKNYCLGFYIFFIPYFNFTFTLFLATIGRRLTPGLSVQLQGLCSLAFTLFYPGRCSIRQPWLPDHLNLGVKSTAYQGKLCIPDVNVSLWQTICSFSLQAGTQG